MRGYIGTNQQRVFKPTEGVPAVSEEQIKCRSWLRSYPDTKKNFCSIVDFGKGAQVFQPSDLCKHLDTNRSEFKRHMEKGVSMTATSLRALHSVVQTIPDSISGCDNGFLKALLEIKHFFQSTPGKHFLAALKTLDLGDTEDKPTAAIRAAVVLFLKTIGSDTELLRLMSRIAADSAKCFLGAVWYVEAKACTHSLQSWADGFPSDSALLGKFPVTVRKWLRNPESKTLLVEAIVEGFSERLNAKTRKTQNPSASWDMDVEEMPEQDEPDDASEFADEQLDGDEFDDDTWDSKPPVKNTAKRSPICNRQDDWGSEPPTKKGKKEPTSWGADADAGNTKERGGRSIRQTASRVPNAKAHRGNEKQLRALPSLTLEPASDSEIEGPENADKVWTEAVTQWPHGEVQHLSAIIETAKTNIGNKLLSMSREDFISELKKVPHALLTYYKLDEALVKLEGMSKMPKSTNLHSLFDRVLAMASEVDEFYAGQSGGSHSASRAPLQEPLDLSASQVPSSQTRAKN